jgi:hypothetical protein
MSCRPGILGLHLSGVVWRGFGFDDGSVKFHEHAGKRIGT